jgi:hypothetical protein
MACLSQLSVTAEVRGETLGCVCGRQPPFSEAVVERYRPNDLIWARNYHLMLLPQMLRERLPDAAIGFFLHIPFPSSEIFP